MNTKSKAKIQKIFRQCLRTALAVLVLLGVLLPAVPVANLGAAPTIKPNPPSFETPIYLSNTRDNMMIYVMESVDGDPTYCMKKGATLPTSSFQLSQETLDNNPLLFYRINWITNT